MSDNKQHLAGTTQDLSLGSLLSTINPVSQFTGSSDYVPQWLVDFYGKQGGLNAQRAAHLTSKIVAGSTATAMAVLMLRSAMHNLKLDSYNKAAITPADKLQSIYRKSPQQLLYSDMKKKSQLITDYNMMAGALPVAAAALVAMATMKVADTAYDSIQSKKLDQNIRSKRDTLNKIILNRAKLNRGIVKPQQLIEKSASVNGQPQSRFLSPKTQRAIGLLAAIMAVSAGAAGFYYAQKTSQNAVKFKALKKGLQQYTKAKTAQDYPRTLTTDPQLAQQLDAGLTDSQIPMDQTAETRNPIDI